MLRLLSPHVAGELMNLSTRPQEPGGPGAKQRPMSEVTAVRTLVKSPPELWAVCSDAQSLAQHLEEFGEIRITRLEPETTVAWEGDRASGTVRIEPSGWGTKVTVTADSKAALEAVLDSLGQAHRRPFSR
jgi:hypothetical protein